MLYAYRMVLYKVLLKKMRFRKLMLFFTGLPLENCEFYSDVAVVFVLKAVKKRITFFIGNQIRHDVYQNLSNALYINAIFWIYRELFFYGVVDTFLNLILCWSWKFGHFATPHSLSTTTAGTSIRATKKWRHVLNSSFYELSNERIDI